MPAGSLPRVLRMSTLFLRTLREDPADAEVPSHRLLVRAGYIRRAAPGGFTWLPLGWIVYRNVEEIVREEMDAAGFQEVHFPALLPASPTRRRAAGPSTATDSSASRTAGQRLPPGADPRGDVHAAREGPVLVVQGPAAVHLPDPDEVPRRGPARAPACCAGREFVMKDSYSFDVDDAGLEVSYQRHRDAYIKTFERLGLPFVIVSAMSGAMGGSASEEFLAPIEVGEDTFVHCPKCDYAANVEAVRVPAPPALPFDGARSGRRARHARHADDRNARRPAQRPRRPAARRPRVDGRRHAEERRRDGSATPTGSRSRSPSACRATATST